MSEKLLRLPAVLELIPVSATSWWRGVKAGRYPKPIKLSRNITCWRESEVLALVKGKSREAQRDPIKPTQQAIEKCSARRAGHCWHTVWVPSTYQARQHDGDGQRCCWCGEKRSLTAPFFALVAHGPHLPQPPNSQS